MSSVGDELSHIAEVEIPAMADDFPDTLDVMVETSIAGPGGGRIKTLEEADADWTGIPCLYDPIQKFGWQKEYAEQLTGAQMYLVVLPVYHNGVRVDLASNHKLRVAARGSEPAKLFKVTQPPGDRMGVIWEVVATKDS